MALPPGMTYRQLLGVWWKRKLIQRNYVTAWLNAVGELLSAARAG